MNNPGPTDPNRVPESARDPGVPIPDKPSLKLTRLSEQSVMIESANVCASITTAGGVGLTGVDTVDVTFGDVAPPQRGLPKRLAEQRKADTRSLYFALYDRGPRYVPAMEGYADYESARVSKAPANAPAKAPANAPAKAPANAPAKAPANAPQAWIRLDFYHHTRDQGDVHIHAEIFFTRERST